MQLPERCRRGRPYRQGTEAPGPLAIPCSGAGRAAGEVVQSFCTSSRRPATGRTRRRLGARPSLRWRSDSGHATRPAAGAESGKPKGPPQNDRPLTGEVVGRQPAGPRGHEPARRRGAHAGRVGELAAVAGLRLLRLRRGRSGSRMVGAPSAGCGLWVVAVAIPPAVDPGEPSRPPPDPPASVPCVKAVLTWRAGRRPAPQEGGSTADGMDSASEVCEHRWMSDELPVPTEKQILAALQRRLHL